MWKFVWAYKANLALSAQTNFHTQKWDTYRVLEKQSRTIRVFTMAQYSCSTKFKFSTSTAVSNERPRGTAAVVHLGRTVGSLPCTVPMVFFFKTTLKMERKNTLTNSGTTKFDLCHWMQG
jgi:hypothetical protein